MRTLKLSVVVPPPRYFMCTSFVNSITALPAQRGLWMWQWSAAILTEYVSSFRRSLTSVAVVGFPGLHLAG